MFKRPARLRFALLVSPVLAMRLAAAGESPQTTCTPGEVVSLDESDRQAITLEVVQQYPLASSSPGIKYAAASCAMPSAEIADVVFYPHEESAGIKQAFHVNCRRGHPGESWACERMRLRRYVRLDSQDFEVRVVGDLKIDEILALIQATRGTAQSTAAGPAVAEAAIIVVPANGGYVVGWGSDEGYGEISVDARLRENGNPAVPEDWMTQISETPE